MALTDHLCGRPSRRQVLIGAVGAGALLGAGAAGLVTRAAPAPVLRTLGRSGERLPAIGLGVVAPRANLRDVLAAYWKAGGRVVDTSLLDHDSELVFGEIAASLGITGNLFLTQRVGATAEELRDNRVARRLDASQARLRRHQTDVLQVGDLADTEAILPVLRRWKEAGRVRHIGVSHHEPRYYPAIEIWMRNAEVDVVQIRYSILTREAEKHILPLAAELGVPVIAAMPMEQGRLLALVEGHRVPDWAAGFGAATWAQFFLKYVLANPAVTVVVPSSGSPAHVAENMNALRGPLPDDEQRVRMVEHLAGLPGFAQLTA